MEPSKVVKENKDDLAKSQEENEMLVKLVGKVTIEKEWLEKKLRSLASSDKKDMIEPKLNDLSLRLQCQLLGLNRSSFYYQGKENVKQAQIKGRITAIYNHTRFHQTLSYKKLMDVYKESMSSIRILTEAA